MNHVEHLHTLALIANKPGATPRTVLIATRHACRAMASEYARIYGEHCALRRQAADLELAMPFTRARAEAIAERCAVLERCAAEIEATMTAIAEATVADALGYSQALGFDALCDLLAVHPLHREKARQNGESLAHIVGADLENSQARRGLRAWFDEPPLTAAFSAGVRYVHAEQMAQALASTIH